MQGPISYRRRNAVGAAVTAAVLLGSTESQAVITFGQLDDFQDGTVMGWMEGPVSPNPPTNIPNGGPNGAGDNFLQNIASGPFGAGSRQIMFNTAQWAGDYTTVSVTRMTGMMANQGTTTLHMRASMRGGLFGTIFCSTNAVMLPPDGVWRPVTFQFNSANMSLVAGTDTLQTVLQSVAELRILSAEGGPSFIGDIVESTVGVDNLRAMTIPGDANFDGTVNLNDFNILASNFGLSSGATWGQADFNFDGRVNLDDFNALAGNFGLSAGPAGPTPDDWGALSAAVPEPVSVWTISLIAAAYAARRVRRTS